MSDSQKETADGTKDNCLLPCRRNGQVK